jgi:tetratricopeptide (TPR) repeat protein
LADVFLSYARPDSASAELVARELGKAGWSVWYDRELPAHRAYSDVIANELESAASVFVLWSEASIASEWVRSEANRARELRKLVQARLDDARLPMPFDQIQCADLRKWRGAQSHPGWTTIRRSIEALVSLPPGQPTARGDRPAASRRAVLAGGAAVVVAGLAGLGWWRAGSGGEKLSPQAQLLMQKGFDALQDNDVLDPGGPGSTMQAIALLTQAAEEAPNSAMIWGGLALAYAVRKRTVPLAERPGLDMRSRAAAKRSLELDPREGRAIGALLLLDPVYRHWLERESADRAAVQKNSSIPLLFSISSDLLGNVGRWREAVRFSGHIDREHFLIPGAERKYIVDLWCSGDLQAADTALQRAVEHWPQNAEIWRTRVPYLMYSGRATDALDLLRDDAERPTEIPDDLVSAMRAAAQGLASALPGTSAVSRLLDFLRKNPAQALSVANACSALGALDDTFEILEGYYFDSGEWTKVAPAAGDADRVTQPLFLPPMKAAWSDARFAPLLKRIGLEEYWRQSGTQPDFRRSGN